MLPRMPLTSQVLTASRVTRLALPLCAAVLFLLPPGTLRAGDEVLIPEIQGCPDNVTDVLTVGVARSPARFETSASLLLLQASSSNPVYTTVTNPYPILSPHWNNRVINPDLTPAFNVGVRGLFDGGGDIRLGWTHLNSFDDGSTVSANPLPPRAGIPPLSGPPSTQALGPTYLVGPPLPFATAAGVLHSAYDAVDLEAGLTLCAGHWRLRPFAGLQYARISQSLTTNYQSVGAIFLFRDVTDSLFNGVGPRVGVDLCWGAGNLDLCGGIAGLALIGRRESSIDFVTSSPQTVAGGIPVNFQSLTSQSTTQVIPGIDARLGAGYSIPVGRFGVLRCEGGYQAAVYVSAVNQYSLTEVENNLPLQNDEGTASTFLRTAVELQRNFLVHGPYVKFVFQF